MNQRLTRHLFIAACLLFTKANSNQIEQADRYFEATLFDKAKPIYQELLKELHVNTAQRAHVRLQLAKAQYLTENYETVIEILSELDTTSVNSNPKIHTSNLEAIFLQGISYNKLKEHHHAIASLSSYLSLSKNETQSFHNNALLELGLAYYQIKQFEEAKRTFSKIEDDCLKHSPFIHAQIYLARIAIAKSNTPEAESRIQSLQVKLHSNAFLHYAVAFLHGELLFHQKQWKEAANQFENAIPPQNPDQTDWLEDSLHYLGWCYLNLGKETDKQNYFIKAEEVFRRLYEHVPSDRATLALGQALLAKGSRLNDQDAYRQLESLLQEDRQFKTRNAKHHALLLRAEAAKTYAERKRFFRQLTSDSHRESPLFPNAWYLRGLNELEEGQQLAEPGKSQEAHKHLEQSISSLKRGFDLLYPSDKKLAALALKHQSQAYYYKQTREGSLKGLSILSRLLNQYRDELFPLLEQPDEIYFLQGLIASQLLDCDEGETFFSIAENSLVHCIESYPKGAFYSESLRLLGTLYYQKREYTRAENVFLELAQLSPPSSHAGEAWYRAAECAEHLNAPRQKVQQYRKKVYEQFSESPFADEAYFRFFTYREYLSGHPESMEHLKDLSQLFPRSLFQMNAYYLLGLEALQERKSPDGKSKKEKDIPAALAAFQKAAQIYDQVPIPQEKKEYFASIRYRALLEKALNLPTSASEQILSLLYQESLIRSSDRNTKMEEECAYYLTQCYLEMNSEDAAQRVLSKTLEKYRQAKITRGYYLSRTWYQSGILAMHQKDFHLALQCLKHAEDAAKGKVLNTDELLDLWIQQSLCHQNQNMMDESMLILSKVINYDAVSSERLKAMFLRAEVYEKQGRLELARRQLEATAKKGGPWAMKAKTKLEENYVYQ